MGKIDNNKQMKRESLLDSAFSLFIDNGFNKTSISDIVNNAGVAKGTFYLYFKDKYDIRNHLIAHKASQIFQAAYADLLRHPDMPKAAFADLWATVQAGNKWRGYVKNLRKDGGYYWVHAVVVPNVREGKVVGYTSVRRKPSRTKIESIIPVYADLKAKEAS